MVQMQSFFKSHLHSDGLFSAGVGPEKIESEPEEALQSATISVVADTPVDRREVSSSVDLSTLVSHKDIPCTELNLIDENVLPPGYISSPPSYRSRPPSFKTNLEETQGPASANTAIWHTSENFENVELSKKEGGRKDCVTPKAEAISAEKIPTTVENPSVNKCLSPLNKADVGWTRSKRSIALTGLTMVILFALLMCLRCTARTWDMCGPLSQPTLFILISLMIVVFFGIPASTAPVSLRVRCLWNCGMFILGFQSISTILLIAFGLASNYETSEQTKSALGITGLTVMSVEIIGCVAYVVKCCVSVIKSPVMISSNIPHPTLPATYSNHKTHKSMSGQDSMNLLNVIQNTDSCNYLQPGTTCSC